MRIGNLVPWLLVAGAIALAGWSMRPRAEAPLVAATGAPMASPVEAAAKEARAAITADSVRRLASRPARGTPTQAEMLARVDAGIRSLDQHFVAEPLDSGWAAARERSIHGFFEPDRLAANGLAAPNDVNASCHSSTCRITAYYADEATAEQTMQQLAMQLVDALPYGAVMPKLMPDGRIQVNAWYSSQQLAP